MFRNRLEELDDIIKLHQQFQSGMLSQHPDKDEIKRVKNYLGNKIKNMSRNVLNDMMELELFDTDFNNRVFCFDKDLFMMNLTGAIEKYFNAIGFDRFMKLFDKFSDPLQISIAYKVMFSIVMRSSQNDEMKRSMLSKMRSEPAFERLPVDFKDQMENAERKPSNNADNC